MTRIHNPTIRLINAKIARDRHAKECTQWDYEGSECLDCAQHDLDVRKARKAVEPE